MNLYADKRALSHSFPTRVLNDVTKLFINDDNTIAIGICGQIPNQRRIEEIFIGINKLFVLLYGELLDIALDVSTDEFSNMFSNLKNVLAITSNKAIIIRDGIAYPQTGHMTALGSGTRSIIPCYYVTKNVTTAFKLSSQIDSLSSEDYISVMADSLNPFILETRS